MAFDRSVTSQTVSKSRVRLVMMAALLIAFAIDVASAAPLRSIDQLRSRACCQRNCSQLNGVVCERACCPSATTANDPESVPTPAKQVQKDSSVAPNVCVVDLPAGFASETAPILRSGGDPPRTFLLNGTLRL